MIYRIPAVSGLGEKLVFSVDYGFINAGTATMQMMDTVRVDDYLCYSMLSTTRTNSFFTRIFPVQDSAMSQIDVTRYFSRGFMKNLHEGKYHEERWFRIDQENGWVFQPANLQNTRYKPDTVFVETGVQDALSALLVVRGMNLQVGDRYQIPVVDNHKYYLMVVVVHKRETVKVPAGSFDCLVVEPLLKTTGVFKSTGKVKVWLTNDERHIPVLMKSKIFIGSISARLLEYTPGTPLSTGSGE